jgi:hypothetical protein
MPLVLISHHVGLTLLLIVIIALLSIAPFGHQKSNESPSMITVPGSSFTSRLHRGPFSSIYLCVSSRILFTLAVVNAIY